MMVRAVGKALGKLILALFLLFGAAWLLAPVEPVDTEISFLENDLPRDLEGYLAQSEQQFSDITPGTEKRIVWAGKAGSKTDLSVIYLHGFSGASEEIRPVPDLVAKALGANLFFTRMAGHGRGGAAMSEPEAGDWIEDSAEALAIGRAIGREVIVISTSTGGTLAAIAATDAGQIDLVRGIVFISPNFRVNHPAALILTAPFGRQWGPLVAGDEIAFQPVNDAHARFWTYRFPASAAFPLGALVKYARSLDYSGVTTPAFFIYSNDDKVVSPRATRQIAERWGGAVDMWQVTLPPGSDPNAHILAGDVLSPGNTDATVQAILSWEAGLNWEAGL